MAFIFITKTQFAFSPPHLWHIPVGYRVEKQMQDNGGRLSYPLGMTNYWNKQELHAEVNFLTLQRTIAFTLLNEAACCLLHTGVNGDFLLTQQIFCSGSTGN